MINAAAELIPSFPYTAKHLFECEFFALELLRFDLIVFHPYRPITLYQLRLRAAIAIRT